MVVLNQPCLPEVRMRVPAELYQIQTTLAQYLTPLRPAQQRGLALWVYGTILAHSACQSAVLTALLTLGRFHTIRQRLREWLMDGADKAAPCATQVTVSTCFAPLMRWVLAWWQGRDLALALDATLHGATSTALVLSVLYRNTAIPVAWHILPAQQPGVWMDPCLTLISQLRSAVPPRMRVLVLADRGLWSPRLWDGIRAAGWHPLLRIQQQAHFTGAGQPRGPAGTVVTPGTAWVGRGKLGTPKTRRIPVTLIAIWTPAQTEPWLVVTDLAPGQVGVSWYALRMGIELGFRCLKRVGWQWEQTRRRDPTRIGRWWLVLAVATLWVVATGTRVEDAQTVGIAPAQLRRPPPAVLERAPRRQGIFRQGLRWMQQQLGRGRLWTRLWLQPDPWPEPPPDVTIRIVDD
jgi:hypothetical protein